VSELCQIELILLGSGFSVVYLILQLHYGTFACFYFNTLSSIWGQNTWGLSRNFGWIYS